MADASPAPASPPAKDGSPGTPDKGKGKGSPLPHTVPCKFFGSAGGCKQGGKCKFSHEKKDYVKLCKFIDNLQECQFGAKCFFRHSKIPGE